MDRVYAKPATTFEEQLKKFGARGLAIGDVDFAMSVLRRVNYYRFTGYLLPYKQADDTYAPGTQFETVYRIYEFDAELRNKLLAILEKIEVSMRVKISYYLGQNVSPLAHRYGFNFQDKAKYVRFRHQFKRDVKARHRKDAVVTHHFRKYRGRFPIWVAVEFMSFNQLSSFYSNLIIEHQQKIANGLGITAPFLRSWMHSLVYLRNVCAHYARVYGKPIVFSPQLPREVKERHGNTHLFALLYVCARLCESRSEWESFLQSIQGIVDAYDEFIELSSLGFPDDWYEQLRRIQRSHSLAP